MWWDSLENWQIRPILNCEIWSLTTCLFITISSYTGFIIITTCTKLPILITALCVGRHYHGADAMQLLLMVAAFDKFSPVEVKETRLESFSARKVKTDTDLFLLSNFPLLCQIVLCYCPAPQNRGSPCSWYCLFCFLLPITLLVCSGDCPIYLPSLTDLLLTCLCKIVSGCAVNVTKYLCTIPSYAIFVHLYSCSRQLSSE